MTVSGYNITRLSLRILSSDSFNIFHSKSNCKKHDMEKVKLCNLWIFYRRMMQMKRNEKKSIK